MNPFNCSLKHVSCYKFHKKIILTQASFFFSKAILFRIKKIAHTHTHWFHLSFSNPLHFNNFTVLFVFRNWIEESKEKKEVAMSLIQFNELILCINLCALINVSTNINSISQKCHCHSQWQIQSQQIDVYVGQKYTKQNEIINVLKTGQHTFNIFFPQ